MEELQQIPWGVFLPLLVSFFGGLFGCILLLLRFPTARHLGKLFLSYAFLILPIYSSIFPISKWQVIIIIALVLYLYARAFFSQKNRLSLFHMVPIVVAIGLHFTPLLIEMGFAIAIAIFYLALLFDLSKKESSQRGIQWFLNPGSRLSWFRNFIVLNSIGLVLLLVGVSHLYFITGYVLLILMLAVYQIFKESDFLTPIPIGNKYQKSTLTPQIKSAVLEKIEGVMENEFYLRDDASLTNLSKELGVTNHHLSQVLNESLKISFQDLIARYRVRRACQILRDEQHHQVKIESVAAMVGYNSKSSFNSAFKKRTGLTPTEYREAKDVRSYGETRLSERERPSYDERKFSLSHVFHLKLNKIMLRFTLRNLRKNKLHSALNIMGLAIGLSACLTIAAYVHNELSYDAHHIDSKNTYRIALDRIYPDYSKQWAISAPIMGPTITSELPEILDYSRFMWDDILFAPSGEPLAMEEISGIDSGFFKIFDTRIVSGQITDDFFEREDGILLTESAAKKYFGDTDPVGELFDLQLPTEESKRVLIVEAVISDPIANSHYSYDVLVAIKLLPMPDWMWNMWGTWGVYTYVKVQPGTDPGLLVEKINEVAERHQSAGSDDWDEWRNAGNKYDYFVQPIEDIHLTSNLAAEFEANSSKTFVYFFALVGGFILLMAIVNFVNLATARASYRTLEVGVRKVVGAGRRDLMLQFLLESTLISAIAMVIALPLTQLFIPQFNQIIGKSISLTVLFSPVGVLILIVAPLLLGVISGFYPALYLSNFGPTAIFQKFIVKRGRESLRHMLVIGQFIIAVILIVSTITVYRQMHFIANKPLGFDKDQLILIEKLPFIGEKIELFKQRAKDIPGVKGVSTTSFPLDEIRSGSTVSIKSENEGLVNTTILGVDENYVPTMGIKVIAGRNILHEELGIGVEGEQEYVLLNKAAVKALGTTPDEVINKKLYEAAGFDPIVVGVIEDFEYESLQNPVEPLQLTSGYFFAPFRSATIKFDPRQMKEAIAGLQKLSNELAPDKLFEFEYMDESMAQYYEAERLTGKLFIIFSGLGIFICCLGLFGLMGYVVEQRAKEVGIRKVMGARIRHIILLLSKDYIRLVLISSVFAIPIAWWGLKKWLESFAFRVDNSLWVFLLGGVLVTIISWATVAFYAYQAAKSNPVNSLRSE